MYSIVHLDVITQEKFFVVITTYVKTSLATNLVGTVHASVEGKYILIVQHYFNCKFV